MESEHCYIAIDMKSFYASVECVARGYDPLTTNLLVADESRSDQTICLARARASASTLWISAKPCELTGLSPALASMEESASL